MLSMNYFNPLAKTAPADVPQERQTAPEDACPSARQVVAMYRGTRILLVEDNPINQELTLALLREIGLVADVAENGLIAVAMVRQTAYALILMDILMPVLDGISAAQLIRQMPGQQWVPILALTASARAEDQERYRMAGMDDFLTKPIDLDALYTALASWLSL